MIADKRKSKINLIDCSCIINLSEWVLNKEAKIGKLL